MKILKSFSSILWLEYRRGWWNFICRVKILRHMKECQRQRRLSSLYWHWGTKAWGANRIRYPGSPCCKIWML